MIKRALTVAALALAFAAPASAAELKIGVVSLAKLAAESPQAKKIQESLEQEFAGERRELLALQNDLKGLQEKFQRDAEVMSQSERSDMERRIRDMGRDLQYRNQTFMEDAQARRNEELAKLQRELVTAVNEFAEKQGYDLVLVDGVIYADEALDITDQVLAQIKK